MKNNEIIIIYDTELKDIVEDIYNSVAKQFEGKNEKHREIKLMDENASKETSIEQKIIRITTSLEKLTENDEQHVVILVVEKALKPQDFKYHLNYDIAGIFRKERLIGKRREYEELGKLEKLIKELIREFDERIESDELGEYIRVKTKNITDWKFEIDWEDPVQQYMEIKYVSVFLDPSMRYFSKILRAVIKDFKKVYNEILDNIEQSYIPALQTKRSERIDRYSKFVERNNNFFEEMNSFISNRGNFRLPSLLIEGQTGTGKSLIAEIIARDVLTENFYNLYKRLSLVNIPDTIIDSELFGNEYGAYTDAIFKPGKIVEVTPGILFLDEISEVPPNVQAKLLLYMDNYEVHPKGYTGEKIVAPVMLIAATNKDIKKEIEKGNFRADLYYRFKYRIEIPPLKSRKEDIRFLINFVLLSPYINPYHREDGYKIKKISLTAIKKLENREYEGNFRELESVLHRAVNNAINEGLDVILDRHIE